MPREDEIVELLVDSEVEEFVDASELNDELYSADENQPESVEEAELNIEEEQDNLSDPILSILESGGPLFLIHKSHQHSDILPTVAADVMRGHPGLINLGVVAPMPRMSPTSLKRFFERMDAVPLRIADPEAFARPDSFGSTLAAQREDKPFVGQSARHWSYFTDPQQNGYTPTWVGDVLDAQRSVEATVLLTPGLWAEPHTPARSLEIMREQAEWARDRIGPSERLVVNLTVPATWITTPTLRNQLLDEIVDMDDNVFYMRVRWPLMGQAYGQIADRSILVGYAEVANVLEENDKALLLPNTGLTGWLALALGAHGFSTGIGSGERAFADTRVIKMKTAGPRPAPIRRIFCPDILHVIDAATAGRLESLGIGPCRCRFCRTQRGLPAGQWDKRLAGAHYLRHIADLTARISTHSRGRRVGARRIVRRASRVISDSSASVPLQGQNDPKHLELWADLLR